MSCSFTERISSLIDGELPAVEAREVERHLVTCAQCAEVRTDFLSLRSQISKFEATVPAAVQNRALAKILAGDGRERRAPAAKVAWSWNWGYGVAALASIAIVALIFVFNFKKPPQEVAYQSPAPASSPEATPSPTVEPPQKTEAPQPKATPARRPLVREPKPGEQFAAIPATRTPKATIPEPIRSADAQTMTALHFEKAENLLRAFRNVRLDDADAASEVRYERQRAEQLIYQNMMLRREADAAGDVQIASLLDSLEPILLDIANLPDRPDEDTVRVIRERVERKNIVALLQINSTALARALD